MGGGAEAGDELAHRPTTGGAFLERLGRDGAAQREAWAAARLAVTLVVAQFVFVNRHPRLAKLPPNQALGQSETDLTGESKARPILLNVVFQWPYQIFLKF